MPAELAISLIRTRGVELSSSAVQVLCRIRSRVEEVSLDILSI